MYKREWVDSDTGYLCAIQRNKYGWHYCGYVAIPSTHSLAEASTDQLCRTIDVHGGVTLAESGISTEGDPVWIVGFDCAHSCDYVPRLRLGCPKNFKDLDYVKQQVLKLAKQLKKREHS